MSSNTVGAATSATVTVSVTTGTRPSPWRTTREAEHTALALALGLTATTAVSLATHFIDGFVVVTAQVSSAEVVVWGSPRGVEPSGSREIDRRGGVAELHRARTGGRLFAFGGSDTLQGVMSVGELVATTDIDDVVMIGDRRPLEMSVPIDTQAFCRPNLCEGRVVLVVRPAAHGMVIPFEQPDPTPCCADH